MPSPEERAIDSAIDEQRTFLGELIDATEQTPELGFFEFRTAELVADAFARLGLTPTTGVARTGVVAELGPVSRGPTIAVLAELDALPGPPDGRAVAHSCGHNLQLAILLATAAGLMPIASSLEGRVLFIAVPAEEFVDLDARLRLRADDEIEFLSGKAELVRLGYFDDVSAAVLVHATTRPEEGALALGGRMNGMTIKHVRYGGRSAHAGAFPDRGVNALTAATLGLAAINAIRDTFPDDEHIRVHGIVTHGGDAVNVVPDDVRLDLYVRAATLEAITATERKVERALRAGAVAVGGSVEIETVPGYLPLRQERALLDAFSAVAERTLGPGHVVAGSDRAGSTDLGDLSHLLPVIQPWAGGVSGELHSPTFRLEDQETAVINPARLVARLVHELLRDRGRRAEAIRSAFVPGLDPGAYLARLRSSFRSQRFDEA